MSVSTDAMLIFGIDLGEEKPSFMGDYEDFEEWAENETHLTDTSNYNEFLVSLENFPVSVETHCSLSCPEYIVCIPGLIVIARRGYPYPLEGLPEVPEDKFIAFNNFCNEHAIGGFPSWLLCSFWEQ